MKKATRRPAAKSVKSTKATKGAKNTKRATSAKSAKNAKSDSSAQRHQADLQGQIAAIHRVQAVIEFTLDGTILFANDNFLKTLGYTLAEITGQHHRMFVEPNEAQSVDYRLFWERLGRGEYDAGVYRRVGRGGKEVWIQASYNPIFDRKGKPFKVVKYATDVTAQRLAQANFEGQLVAIGKAQAVIEFNLDGTIRTANDNFLNTLGYSLPDIQGQHHRMFVDPAYAQSIEYRLFWEKLARGEYDAGEYKRIGRNGREVWIQASYNPIFDLSGKPFKVVKYATDITARKHALGESMRVMQALAHGDLTQQMDGRFEGEFAVLRDSVNGFIVKLRDMAAQIGAASSTIAGSSSEIARGNVDLSERTERQASALEETAASLEEFTGTVKQNASNARQANQLAGGARDQAEKGGTVVGSAVSAMAAIHAASKKIADIISVIDDIAFQTNLLALNAAVEAARAGEQGRGFAVVASEVRNLAQRSATAAKEIKALIKDSVEKVDEGSRLVNASGDVLHEIVTSVKKVSDIIAEIAAASREQASGIEQVNTAVVQMDETTQQNAALVEEAAAAAASMDEQAQRMVDLVRFFRLGGEEQRLAATGTESIRPAASVSGVSGAPALPARAGVTRQIHAVTSARRSARADQTRPAPAKGASAILDEEGDEWKEL